MAGSAGPGLRINARICGVDPVHRNARCASRALDGIVQGIGHRMAKNNIGSDSDVRGRIDRPDDARAFSLGGLRLAAANRIWINP